MAVPYTFGAATSSIPLSQLDSNFATTITLGNTAIQLGNTVTTLNNMTLANVTISGGTVTLPAQQANAVVYLNSSNVVTANASVLSVVSGNLGVGTTSPSQRLHIASAGAVIGLVQNTASNADARLRVQNTQSNLDIGQDSTGGYILQAGAYPLSFYTNNAERARITSGGNFQFMTADAGIVFNKTGALTNSTLNDYEEGTFTPTLVASGYTFTYAYQIGIYTKIGNLVTFKLYMVASFSTGSGTVQASISGLPFTASSSTANFGGVSVNPDTGSAYLTTGGYTMSARTGTSTASLYFQVGNGGNAPKSTFNWAGMTAGTEFEISGHYYTT